MVSSSSTLIRGEIPCISWNVMTSCCVRIGSERFVLVAISAKGRGRIDGGEKVRWEVPGVGVFVLLGSSGRWKVLL
jgi:hypothetical protein